MDQEHLSAIAQTAAQSMRRPTCASCQTPVFPGMNYCFQCGRRLGPRSRAGAFFGGLLVAILLLAAAIVAVANSGAFPEIRASFAQTFGESPSPVVSPAPTTQEIRDATAKVEEKRKAEELQAKQEKDAAERVIQERKDADSHLVASAQDPDNLLSEYTSNEVAADAAFKGSQVVVRGKVDHIGKDILNHSYITLAGSGGIRHVQCFFPADWQIVSLTKGDSVVVVGTCNGLMMNVLIENCRILKRE